MYFSKMATGSSVDPASRDVLSSVFLFLFIWFAVVFCSVCLSLISVVFCLFYSPGFSYIFPSFAASVVSSL